MKRIVAAVAMIALYSAAFATPSTQIWIPSTDIQPFMKVHVGEDLYMKARKTDAGVREATVVNNGLTVGVLPLEKFGLEAGIDQRIVGAEPYDSVPLYFNAKAGTPEDALFAGMPAIAAGIYDAGTKAWSETDPAGTNFNVWYALAAKTLGALGRFSAGYYAGSKEMLLDKDGVASVNGLLLSWDRTISEISDKLWLAVDYQGGGNGYGAFSFGGAYKFAPNAGLLLGYDIFNNTNLMPTVTLQADFDF